MLDAYGEIWDMARGLDLPTRPLWWDRYGCPRWKEPKEELKKFIKPIACQACGQQMLVCLVDDVYRHYGGSLRRSIFFSGKLPKHWGYGDPPNHPAKPDEWDKESWSVCMGVTMGSIPHHEFDEWNFAEGMPRYKDEHLAEKES